MRFKILGPLEITADDGRPVAVSRRLHRCTLATLLLNAGQPCSPAGLMAGLWGDDPPLSPDVSLRSCVYGIRKLLPEPGRLQTHPAGYLIQVHPGELDLATFRDLASRGRNALDSADPPMAAELLAGALELWRDPPLADLPASPERERLFDQRSEVKDALIDARLALGRHRQLLAELRATVTTDPLREHAWAQLIIALYRSGARAEALAAFGRVRMMLVTAYGIEPGPELQDLHRKVLADDPALMVTAKAGQAEVLMAQPHPGQPYHGQPAQAQPARAWPAPCQLPASVCDFAGRSAELGVLLGRLTGDGMAVTVVTGMLGAGKTALTVHAAHLARSNFPDGQLYACLDDDGRPRDAQVVLAELLRGLGVAAGGIPAPGFEREALYRSVLAGRRVLVLADGAVSAAQVRPLLPGTAGSAVIITSRARLADLDGARVVEVGDMPPADAASLIATIAGRRADRQQGPATDGDGQAPNGAALAIASACGHLPFALRIAGARLADDPDLTMDELAILLSDERRLLDHLVVGEMSARARVAAAARAAGEAAKRALALLAAAWPGDAASSPVIAPCHDSTTRAAAPALAEAGLLRRVTGGDRDNDARYHLHPLVRAYANELLAGLDPALAGLAEPGTDRVRLGQGSHVSGR